VGKKGGKKTGRGATQGFHEGGKTGDIKRGKKEKLLSVK